MAARPLLGTGTRRINDWEEWLELWRGTALFELQCSLLDCGFSVQADKEQAAARVIFYLRVAHEVTTYGTDLAPDSTGDARKQLIKYRKALAHKALIVLVGKFFNNQENTEYERPSWYDMATNPAVTTELVHFFEMNRYGSIGIVQEFAIPDKNARQTVERFLLNFCKLGWITWVPNRREDYVQKTPACPDLQPHFLSLLLALGKFQWLISADEYPLTEASWTVLEELAMAEQPFPDPASRSATVKRCPVSLEEAVANGSPAAHVLLIRRVKEAEATRAAELQSALEAGEAARRRIQAASS